MSSVSWKTAVAAAAWVLIIAAVLGLGIVGYRHQSKSWAERDDLRKSVAVTTAALNDFIDATTEAKSAITYKETFDLADEEIRRTGDASVKAQVAAGVNEQQKAALRAYLAGVANLVRLQDQEARKALAFSGSNSAAEEAIAQAKSANAYTADVYISSARRALGEMTKAAGEQVAAAQDRKDHVKAFRAQLAKLRPALVGYDIVTDAELAKLNPPEKASAKAS